MKRLSILIGAVLIVSWVTPASALRYTPGYSGGGYVAVNLLGPTEVQSGDNFTYTVILTNDSSGYAKGVQVTYRVPDGLRWLDRFSHPTCEQRINEILCMLDFVAPGSQSLPLRFTTDRLTSGNPAFCPRTITSKAQVSAGSSDTFSGDNTSPTLSTRITCYDPPTRSYRRGVDLKLNLTTPGSITVGEALTMTTVITNAGTEDAMFITVLLSAPTGLSINDLPRVCQITGSMITCTNFTLRSGESRVLTFTIPIPSTLSCPASLEWRAQVYSGSQNSSSVYRTSTARTSIACRPVPVPTPPSNSSLGGGGSSNGGTTGGGGFSGNNTGGNTGGGNTAGGNTSGRGASYHTAPYWDPLHVCDLELDVILPCGHNYRTGGGSSGGGSGGAYGGSTGGGSSGGSFGGTSGIGGSVGGTSGSISGGGFFGGGIGGSLSGDTGGSVGGEEEKEEKEVEEEEKISTLTSTTWSLHLPPDTSGNWVWNGQMWVYAEQESIVAAMDINHWTLQYCTGNERETIAYEIEVRNTFETPIKNIDVVEMLNPTAVCIKKVDSALIGPRHILWTIETLAPNATQSIRYTVGILPSVPDQFVIANLTHAGTAGPHILTRDFEMVEVSRKSQ